MKTGDIIQVSGPVWLLVGGRQGNFPNCNGVLIKDKGQTALIDTGAGREALQPLADSGQVDMVINTHTHPDHAPGNHLFAGREILVPHEGWETAGNRKLLSERLTEPGALALEWQSYVRETMDFHDQPPTGHFSHGQEIKVGGQRVLALHTPGHTIDHYCFWLPDHKVMLSADIDLTQFGPYYGHRESSISQTAASVELVKSFKPRVLISSHRPPLSSGIDEALDEFAAFIPKREKQLLDMLDHGKSLEQLVQAAPFYGGHKRQPNLTRYWEGQMIKKHMQLLMEKGNVRMGDRGFMAA